MGSRCMGREGKERLEEEQREAVDTQGVLPCRRMRRVCLSCSALSIWAWAFKSHNHLREMIITERTSVARFLSLFLQ